MYAPCWNCVERDSGGTVIAWLAPVGCQMCMSHRRRDHVCNRCGAYVSRWGFLRHGERLPPAEFDRYPAAWRIAYWAVYGAPTPALTGVVREHLHDLANLHFVNVMRREIGEEPYPEFAVVHEEFLLRYQSKTAYDGEKAPAKPDPDQPELIVNGAN